jgi:hypothetical protein
MAYSGAYLAIYDLSFTFHVSEEVGKLPCSEGVIDSNLLFAGILWRMSYWFEVIIDDDVNELKNKK